MRRRPRYNWEQSLDRMAVDMEKVLEFVLPERKEETRKLLEETYDDLITTNHPVVWSENNVIRWKQDPTIEELFKSGARDRNKAGAKFFNGEISLTAYQDLYRRLGYSLDGYGNVMSQHRQDDEDIRSG